MQPHDARVDVQSVQAKFSGLVKGADLLVGEQALTRELPIFPTTGSVLERSEMGRNAKQRRQTGYLHLPRFTRIRSYQPTNLSPPSLESCRWRVPLPRWKRGRPQACVSLQVS